VGDFFAENLNNLLDMLKMLAAAMR